MIKKFYEWFNSFGLMGDSWIAKDLSTIAVIERIAWRAYKKKGRKDQRAVETQHDHSNKI